MKQSHYWLGEPIDDMPRERLLEIIDHLSRQLEDTRKNAARDVAFMAFAAKRAANA